MGDSPVVVLAGGTGGAKLARGLLDVIEARDLVVIANTGDDIEIYGAYVSPDPDLVTFWLADRIDERGWGLAGDTFAVMDGLRELGVEVWFNLGDRDLAIGLERARRLRAGETLTAAHAALSASLEVKASVLPMSDQPVRTRVRADGQWWGLQEYLIRRRGAGQVQDVDFRGRAAAATTPQALDAVGRARAIIIGPSNPAISIGPILALPGLREAVISSPAPVVAVSPFVGGEVVKGPTAAFMQWLGQPLNGSGLTAVYGDLLDGLVCDETSATLPRLETDMLMSGPAQRRRLAEQTLSFTLSLA